MEDIRLFGNNQRQRERLRNRKTFGQRKRRLFISGKKDDITVTMVVKSESVEVIGRNAIMSKFKPIWKWIRDNGADSFKRPLFYIRPIKAEKT